MFRRAIVSGRTELTPKPSEEAVRQLRLRYRLAVEAAEAYFDAGFVVVLEDVIAGSHLPATVGMVRSRPLHVVVLLPSVQALAIRDERRARSGYAAWSVAQLHDAFVRGTPHIGTWLDTSEDSPDETVARIISAVPAVGS